MYDTQRLRYSRHLLLQGWSEASQLRLMDSHALVVGVGGLGAPAALYLAAAGVGRITLVDPDRVELSNLQRQICHATGRIGQHKVHSAAQAIHALNPAVTVHTCEQAADEAWLSAWLREQQAFVDLRQLVVLDCTDRLSTRHAINRVCWQAGVAVVSGAAVQWDAQVSLFDPHGPDSPCYACLYPLPPPSASVNEAMVDTPCGTLGVFAPVVGIAGTLQAGEAIKYLMGHTLEGSGHAPLAGRLFMLDARDWHTTSLRVKPRSGCPVCDAAGPRHLIV